MRRVPERVLNLRKSSAKCPPQEQSFPEAAGLLPPFSARLASCRPPPPPWLRRVHAREWARDTAEISDSPRTCPRLA